MSSKRIRSFMVLMILCASTAGRPMAAQPAGRAIPYDPHVPIAARLVPGDVLVLVQKALTTPFVPSPTASESFDAEIRRLAGYEAIATVSVSSTEGGLVDRGTWIRTRVDAQTIEVLKGGARFTPAGSVQFWHDGGKLQMDTVIVSAGVFPEFRDGRRYLVFLRTDQSTDAFYAARAYQIDASGRLESVVSSNGESAWPLPSNLSGRPLGEVASALAVRISERGGAGRRH